jgi:Asp-tRNA(Asn)/Glu-tRNA(Gln) amidotransferase A subunit family amidase
MTFSGFYTEGRSVMVELADLGAAEGARRIREGLCTSEELVSACLARIEEREPIVRAFVDLQPERAIESARERDRQGTNDRGVLHGVPVAIKEIYDVAGFESTWGSPVHAGRIPETDADVTKKLRNAGAVIIGTTVSTEYAAAAAGPTTNPSNPNRTPGGSSSGSTAAVAASMVPLAIGSQTIGSIVRPAVYCGVFGLKPSRGAIGSRGAMPLAQYLDHPGPLARHLDDLILACQSLFFRDSGDPYSADVAPPAAIEAPPGLRLLYMEGPLRHRIETPTQTALERARKACEDAGHTFEEVDLPASFDNTEPHMLTVFGYEVAKNHAGDRDRSGDLMSPKMREIIDLGRAISEEAYDTAKEEIEKLKLEIAPIVSGDTVVLAPAVDSYAPSIEDVGTGPNNLQGLPTALGLPSLAVPCGLVDDLPVGVQLFAPTGREDLLIAAARLISDR